jgi:hypothetical protein
MSQSLQYYYDKDSNRRKNGIYCHSFDRWLIVDNEDFWVTLETAKVLSSKIASVVYVLPNNIGKMDNTNCLEFMIFDKTRQKRGTISDLIHGQTPILKIIDNPLQISYQGTPEDFKAQSSNSMLSSLKEYADYVHKAMYAGKLCSITVNFYDTYTISQEFFPKEWVDGLSSYTDRSFYPNGIIQEIKKILYFSQTLKEAKFKINKMWEQQYETTWWVADYYYELMGETHSFKRGTIL